jgi:cytidyltransferase-like protein
MGGAAGHMAHLHENIWLTFRDIKSFLNQVANAEISPIEKVDGQNIFFRWTPEGIRTARNMGNITSGGMTEAEYREKWNGHPAEAAFIKGFETIKKAMEKMPATAAQESFDTGQPNTYRFVNCEIMLPESENIIVYDGSYIVLHNLKEYAPIGKGGKMVESELFTAGDQEFDNIVKMISDVEKTIDADEWQVFGPRYVELKNIADNVAYENAVVAIDRLGYSDDQTLSDLVEDKLKEELANSGLPEDKFNLLIKRVIQVGEKTPADELISVNAIKKGLTSEQKKIVTKYASATKARAFIGKAVSPFARAVSDFAIEALRGLHSFFMTDGDAEIERMRSTLLQSIEALENYTGDNAEKYGELLEKQLAKLGPIENVASTVEGLIFEYPPGSKKLVKLTGSFAMANQIIGRAKRMPPPVSENNPRSIVDVSESIYNLKELEMIYEAIGAPTSMQQDFGSVAIIPGAFKPPHAGHAGMVDHYLSMADKVIVYISDPKSPKSQRKIGGVTITAEMSKAMWEILLSGKPNVEVRVSPAPSPVTIAYDSIMPANPEKNYDGTPYQPGTTVYLGSSVKGNDAKRFSYALAKASPDLNVPDPVANAAPAIEHGPEYIDLLMASKYATTMPSVNNPSKDPADFHASDFRYILESAARDPEAKQLAAYFVGGLKNVEAFMSVIGLTSINENYSRKYSLITQIYGE